MKTLADLTAPRAVQRRLLEADVQEQCVEWARRRGYWARKFSSIAQRSVPDYLFSRARFVRIDGMLIDTGTLPMKFATEFKRPDCKIDKETGLMSTKAQVDEQTAMRETGWYVFECNDVEAFKKTVLRYEGEHRVQ